MTTLTDLPYDVLKYIFTFFKPAEAIQQVSTCSFFKKCFEDNSCSIWETYSRREFGDDFVKKFSDIANEIGWKEFYKEYHSVIVSIEKKPRKEGENSYGALLDFLNDGSGQSDVKEEDYLILDKLVLDEKYLEDCFTIDFNFAMERLQEFCSSYPSHRDKLLHNLIKYALFLELHFMGSGNAEKNLEKFRKTYPDYEKELLSQIAEIRRAGHENFCSSIDKAPQH